MKPKSPLQNEPPHVHVYVMRTSITDFPLSMFAAGVYTRKPDGTAGTH